MTSTKLCLAPSFFSYMQRSASGIAMQCLLSLIFDFRMPSRPISPTTYRHSDMRHLTSDRDVAMQRVTLNRQIPSSPRISHDGEHTSCSHLSPIPNHKTCANGPRFICTRTTSTISGGNISHPLTSVHPHISRRQRNSAHMHVMSGKVCKAPNDCRRESIM